MNQELYEQIMNCLNQFKYQQLTDMLKYNIRVQLAEIISKKYPQITYWGLKEHIFLDGCEDLNLTFSQKLLEFFKERR
jgi:hypothetical protein